MRHLPREGLGDAVVTDRQAMKCGPERNPEDVALIQRLADDLRRAYEVISRHDLMHEVFPPNKSIRPSLTPIEGLEINSISDLLTPEQKQQQAEYARQWRASRARAKGTLP